MSSRSSLLVLVVACAIGLAACTDPWVAGDAGVADARIPFTGDAGPVAQFEHTFPAYDVPIGADVQGICQSWTLGNDEEIWVHEVEMTAGTGWHHSNWMWVPETAFAGDDGTWRCRDRGFDELAATTAGGSVFFAQSTQSTHELQTFPAGAAYRIPPRARIIGSVHLINFSGAELSTDLTFRIGAVAPAEVITVLRPLALDARGIDLAPRSTTRVVTECDLRRANLGPLDFSVYYVLPHYHALADGLRVEIFGGDRDGEVVFETTGGIGNALGGPLTPPLHLGGATGLRVSCLYRNDGEATVTYGPGADDEMCTILAYTSSSRILGGISSAITSRTTEGDGTVVETGSCLVAGF